ncbi:MAG TPA: hypothetical protein VFC19_16330 [Candidatus Limnocylindrales bacterium]|nr:hypothetical protein [Candidatus Limnocylindrales bacterium]
MYQPEIVPAAGKPARPMVVTLAAVILGLMALLSLLAAIIGLVSIGQTEEEFRRLAASEPLDPDEIDSIVSFLRFSLICTAVIAVLFAVLLAVLAWGVARGSQPARVVTWIVCGVGVLWACCNGFGSIASFASANPSSTDPDQIAGNLAVRALPDWAGGVLLGSSAISVLGYIATAVLLALPAANAYFKGQRPAGWSPPAFPQNPPIYPPPPTHPAHPEPPPPPPPPPSDQ